MECIDLTAITVFDETHQEKVSLHGDGWLCWLTAISNDWGRWVFYSWNGPVFNTLCY